MIGFAAWARKVAANPNASYGRIVEHSYERDPVPRGLRLSAGNAQVTANWEAVPGATGYTLYYSTASLASTTNFTGIRSVTVTGTSATVGLTNGRTYYFVVVATTNAGAQSTPSTEATATPQLPAPTGLRLARGNAEVAAVWAAVPNATGYRVYYSTTSLAGTTNFNGVRFVDVSGGSMITTLVTGLINGTEYYFRVIATSAGHQSAASTEASATPQLPAPVGLTVTPGNAQVAASWLSVPNTTGYKLYFSTSPLASTTNFNGVSSVTVTGTSTTATVTGLTNGTQYYFVVVATTSAGGESAASTEASATTAPAAPTNLTAMPGNAQVMLSWNPVSGAARYTVYYSTSTISDLNAPGVNSVSGTGTSATVTMLTTNSQFYFKVVASNAGGDSVASSEVNIPKLATGFTVFRDAFVTSSSGEGPQMVVLPTGNFTMGTASPNGNNDERPTRMVTINNRIAMGMYEVTFADYRLFANAVASRSLPSNAGWPGDTRPVINVNQADANAYAAWLNTQTGKTTYRLPSEAEWEYAGRAGETTLYSFGDSISCNQANYGRQLGLGGSCNTGRDASLARTVPVGRFMANAFGLYDMHGNVGEWVQDCATTDYTGASTDGSARTTCTGPTALPGAIIRRGGSWDFIADRVRVASRDWGPSSRRQNNLGFRLVQVLPTTTTTTP